MRLFNLKSLSEIISPDHVFWSGDLREFCGFKGKIIYIARVLRLVGRGFKNDQCGLHASALTYYSLMSIVPLLALGLALARVFGGGDMAKEQIVGKITEFGESFVSEAADTAGQQMTSEFVSHLTGYVERIFDQIGNISFGTLGGVGLIMLLLMAVTMLSKVEESFNCVWHVPPRSLWRKFADYVAIIIIVPFLGISASTLPVVSTVTNLTTGASEGFFGSSFIPHIVRFLIVSVLTVSLFTVILMFVPNTKVKFKAGFMGAVITAIMFFIWLKACTALQVGVVKYSKLYGGLAALPILLAWTYMSWEILFFGSELTFAIQHSASFFRDEGAAQAPGRVKWRLAVILAVEMTRRFKGEGGTFDVRAFSEKEGISTRLAIDIANLLVSSGIAAVTAERAYVLSRSPDSICLDDIFSAVMDSGTKPESLGCARGCGPIDRRLNDIDAVFSSSLQTKISDIA